MQKQNCKSLASLIFEAFQVDLLSCCPLKSFRALRKCKCQNLDPDPLQVSVDGSEHQDFHYLGSLVHCSLLITRYHRLFSYKEKSSVLDDGLCSRLRVLEDYFLYCIIGWPRMSHVMTWSVPWSLLLLL